MIPLLIDEVLFVQNATGVGVNGGNLVLKGTGFTVLFISEMIIYVLTPYDSLLAFGSGPSHC